jgi:hypothetical protein
MQIYNSVYVPVLTCGAESWPMTGKHISRIQASEMKFLRRVIGKPRLDHIRNTRIREVEQKPLQNQIQEKQLNSLVLSVPWTQIENQNSYWKQNQ